MEREDRIAGIVGAVILGIAIYWQFAPKIQMIIEFFRR